MLSMAKSDLSKPQTVVTFRCADCRHTFKTAPEEIKAKLFKNMSNRAAQLLMEDLEALGPTKLSDVEKAQAEVVQKCKELEGQGKAIISRGGDGDALV